MVGRAANQVKCTARHTDATAPGSSSIGGAAVIIVHAAGHAGPAVAGDPDHHVIDAAAQVATAAVLGREGVEVGQQAYRRERPQVGWRPRGPATGRSVSRGEAEQYDRGEQQRRDDHVQESGRSQVQKSHRLARSAVRFARTGSLSQMPSGWAPVVPYQQSPRDRLRQRGFQRPCRQDRRMIGASRSARPRRRSFPSATAAAIVENPVYDSSIV
jgi:hypothetical protein